MYTETQDRTKTGSRSRPKSRGCFEPRYLRGYSIKKAQIFKTPRSTTFWRQAKFLERSDQNSVPKIDCWVTKVYKLHAQVSVSNPIWTFVSQLSISDANLWFDSSEILTSPRNIVNLDALKNWTFFIKPRRNLGKHYYSFTTVQSSNPSEMCPSSIWDSGVLMLTPPSSIKNPIHFFWRFLKILNLLDFFRDRNLKY